MRTEGGEGGVVEESPGGGEDEGEEDGEGDEERKSASHPRPRRR